MEVVWGRCLTIVHVQSCTIHHDFEGNWYGIKHAVANIMPRCLPRVKAFVVRAEDARLLGDMPLMRKLYAELHTLNGKLIGEYAKRANNHQVWRAPWSRSSVSYVRRSSFRACSPGSHFGTVERHWFSICVHGSSALLSVTCLYCFFV